MALSVVAAAPRGPLPAYRIGADENGLGPRLGPLIVTAVLAEVSEAGHKAVSRAARGPPASLLGDSKALLSHGDVSLGEAWARILVARASGGAAPHTTIEEVVRAVSADSHEDLQRPCPERAKPQCWSTKDEAFEAGGDLLADVEWALATLEEKGVRVKLVRSVIVCTNALNEAVKRGKSRFHVDLHAMERLMLDMRATLPSDVLSVCGKVGGIGHYQAAFGPLNGRLSTTLVEKRHESAYHFPGLGEIRFVVDADANDRLVGLASLVGKWLREVLMGRITRHYQAFDPELPSASGYHDPITEQFVAATRLHRKRAKIPDHCFERTSLASLGE
jgi:ribonuclease HII